MVKRLACIVLLTALACSSQEPASDGTEREGTGLKVVVIGIDGASFGVLDPLLEAGELPGFAALIDNGARGALRSREPMISPALWTTIATGRTREHHGIENFVRDPNAPRGQQSLVTSSDRRVPALWNMATAMRKSVGVSGWWATWPAERVTGWVVSDRVNRTRWAEWTDGNKEARVTHPEAMAAEIRGLIVDPALPDRGEIEALVELTPTEWSELEASRRPIFGHGLSVLKFAWANQRSHERIVAHQLDRGQPELLLIQLIANDPISHTFWHYYQPERFRGVDADQAARLGKIIGGISRHNDRTLRTLIESFDENTVVLVVSDHGFQASGRVPQLQSSRQFGAWLEQEKLRAAGSSTVAVGQSGKHQLDGVFIASGGPILPGVTVETAKLVDVAPTVLALLGLPIAEDLEGRVLTEIIDPAFLAKHPRQTIPSYAALIEERAEESPEDMDPETLEMLRSLGYIN